MDRKEITEKLADLLRQAGEIMLGAHAVDPNGDVRVKPGTSNFVTEYDVRVQEFLMREIAKIIPNAVFIAEEKKNDPAVLNGEFCFIIDPIDGTTNFIHDYRHSCISLAMVSRGETVFGAIYTPYLGELFSAEKGAGAYLNGRPMRVSDHPMELSLSTFGTSPYYKDTLAKKSFALAHDVFLATADIRRSGSAALDLAYLAAGRIDVFFEFILSPWDIAAGVLLISEAGGIVTQLDGSPVTLTAPCPVFAGNEKTHPVLLRMAEKYR